MSGDESNGPPTHPDGTGYWNWSRSLMHLDDHGDAAIFNPHSDLVLFDLHMLSAELHDIRKKNFPSVAGTTRSVGSNEGSMPNLFSSVTSWRDAKQSGAIEQWKEYSSIVRRYVKALLRAAELAKLSKAGDYDKAITMHLFQQNAINLASEDKALYKKSSTDYLVVLKPDPYREFVSRSIARVIRKYPRFFGRLFGPVFGRARTDMEGIEQFSNTRIQILASMIITLLASTGLVVNAVGLYYTRAIGSKLGMIAGFSVLHAVFLSLFLGSAIEVVTGLSTWAAVQVFFITATEDSYIGRTMNSTTLQP